MGGRAQRGGAPLPSRQGHRHPRGRPLRLTLTPRPRSCWPGFSPSSSSHTSTLCSLGGGRRAQPTPDTGRGAPPGGWRVRVNDWGFFCREFVSSPPVAYLSDRSFIPVWTRGRLYFALRSNTVSFILLLSCPSSALGSPLTCSCGSAPGDQRRGQPPAPCRDPMGHQDVGGFPPARLTATCHLSQPEPPGGGPQNGGEMQRWLRAQRVGGGVALT